MNTHYCALCLAKFETKTYREFCTPICAKAQRDAEKGRHRRVREAARLKVSGMIGANHIPGGKQAVNRQNSDETAR